MFKDITKEIKNTWSVASFIAQAVGAVVLIAQALGNEDPLPRYALAIAGGVLTVTLLATLYALFSKK